MAAKPIKKDSADVLDYRVLWGEDPTWDADDAITASTFVVEMVPEDDEAELTVDNDDFDDSTTTVWLSGGTVGVTYRVVNHVVTEAGRELDKQFGIIIDEQAR